MGIVPHQLIAYGIMITTSILIIIVSDINFLTIVDGGWGVFLVVLVANIPACIFLRFVPIKCYNCGSLSLFNCDFLNMPRWAPQNYKCRSCKYACYQYNDKIHTNNDT